MQNRRLRFTISALAGISFLLALYLLLLRPWHLRWGATPAELTRTYPGDDLLPGVTGHVTHAITIHATPEQIWPWLMQLGQDRAGFYSYSRIENLFGCDMPSVERLVPLWPERAVGEKVWFATPRRYHAKAYMVAAIVDSHRALVLSAGDDLAANQAATWGFFLEPISPTHTRLIVRLRAASPPSAMAGILGYAFWEPAHFLMEHKMMTNLKRLAQPPAAHPDRAALGNSTR